MPNHYSAEVVRLARAAGCSERTVCRYIVDPSSVNRNNQTRIEKVLRINAAAIGKTKRAKASKR